MAVNGNGKAAVTETAAPVTSATGSDDVVIKKQTGGRPDLQDHHNQLDELKKEIDALTNELNGVKGALAGAPLPADTPEGKRQAQLRTELDTIRQSQAGNKGARGKVLDDVKILQDGLTVKIKTLQAAKSKSTYKSPADIDAAIARLTAQVDTGALKLVDEKRALAEISSLRKSRKAVEAFAEQQKAIDEDREKIEKLRAQLDDPASKALSARFDEIRKELDEIKAKTEKSRGSRTELMKKRTDIQAKLDAKWGQRRARQEAFRTEKDVFETRMRAEREKRNEKFKEEKKQEEQRKRKEEEATLREEAAMPAYGKEIEDCDVLIRYFSGGKAGASEGASNEKSAKEQLQGVKELELRKVEADDSLFAGARIAKKKGAEDDDEEGYFMGSKAKKGKGKKKSSNRGTPLSLSTENGAAGSEENGAEAGVDTKDGPPLNVPLPTLSALLALNIPPPTHHGDVARVVENLQRKKAFYVGDQDRKTKENIAKIEKKLGALNVQEDANGGDAAAAAEAAAAAPATQAAEA